MIQIPISDWDLIIDVRFILLTDKIPTLLSLKEIIHKKPDISPLRCSIHFKYREQKLTFMNGRMVQKWKLEDIP